MEAKFGIYDTINYNGNIYLIWGIKFNEDNIIYDVKCLKNNYPNEPLVDTIGSCDEDKMELVDFKEPNEKEQWIEQACEWIKQNVIWNKKFIADFANHMKNKCMTKEAVLISNHYEVARLSVDALEYVYCMAGNPNAEDLLKVVDVYGASYWCDSLEFINR